ncbi:hypothetical protein [Actinomadura madurae]|uniref:hypothetical protein n=1 Tax=Actinomadura madurae TaxID=1993 RepID=UPI0020D24F54|nr:hypothetical protein [Actinomadura madurae]MCQ0015253.1 hypothetical protein [Actinomadura madurae]
MTGTLAPAFADALSAALDIAALSPSSHNCQPWGLARMASPPARAAVSAALGAAPEAGGEFLVLAADRERRLGALPAHALEMELSCGLYWRFLERALAAQGWTRVRSRVFPREASPSGLGLPGTWEPLCAAEFRREGSRTARSAPSPASPGTATPTGRRSVPTRSTRRCSPRSPATGGRGRAAGRRQASAVLAGTVPVRRVRRGARGRDFAHAGAWRETHSFIRWSAGAASARGDGFTLEHLFGPLPAHDRWARRLALAPAVMAALSRIGYPRFLAGQLAAVVRRSPVIVLMGLPGGGPRAARRAVGRGGARGLLAGRHRRRPRPAPDQHRDPARRPPPRSPAAVLPARPRVLRGAARAPRRRVPGVPRRPAAAACRAL